MLNKININQYPELKDVFAKNDFEIETIIFPSLEEINEKELVEEMINAIRQNPGNPEKEIQNVLEKATDDQFTNGLTEDCIEFLQAQLGINDMGFLEEAAGVIVNQFDEVFTQYVNKYEKTKHPIRLDKTSWFGMLKSIKMFRDDMVDHLGDLSDYVPSNDKEEFKKLLDKLMNKISKKCYGMKFDEPRVSMLTLFNHNNPEIKVKLTGLQCSLIDHIISAMADVEQESVEEYKSLRDEKHGLTQEWMEIMSRVQPYSKMLEKFKSQASYNFNKGFFKFFSNNEVGSDFFGKLDEVFV